MNPNQLTGNIEKLGIDFNNIPKPGGSYTMVNVRDNIAYVAIQFPIKNNTFYHLGRLGKDVTTEEGYQGARLAATNVLAQIHKFVGVENIVGLNHADIYYQASDDWDEGPRVADGASDLFLEILGDKGVHTRGICSIHKLPKNHSVALVTSFTIKTGS